MLRGHEGENPVFNNNSIKVNGQPLQPVVGWGEGDPNIVNNLTMNNVTNSVNTMLSVGEVNHKNNVKLSKKKRKNIKGIKKNIENFEQKRISRYLKLKHLFASKVKGSKNFRRIFEVSN